MRTEGAKSRRPGRDKYLLLIFRLFCFSFWSPVTTWKHSYTKLILYLFLIATAKAKAAAGTTPGSSVGSYSWWTDDMWSFGLLPASSQLVPSGVKSSSYEGFTTTKKKMNYIVGSCDKCAAILSLGVVSGARRRRLERRGGARPAHGGGFCRCRTLVRLPVVAAGPPKASLVWQRQGDDLHGPAAGDSHGNRSTDHQCLPHLPLPACTCGGAGCSQWSCSGNPSKLLQFYYTSFALTKQWQSFFLSFFFPLGHRSADSWAFHHHEQFVF